MLSLQVHRYPIINSGDNIALRLAFTSGYWSKRWFGCLKYFCIIYTCRGLAIASSKLWPSCNHWRLGVFTITAKGKMNGQPIGSGDTVSLSSNRYGSSYRLSCTASNNTKCLCNRKYTIFSNTPLIPSYSSIVSVLFQHWFCEIILFVSLILI